MWYLHEVREVDEGQGRASFNKEKGFLLKTVGVFSLTLAPEDVITPFTKK